MKDKYTGDHSIVTLIDMACISKILEPLDADLCPFCGLELAIPKMTPSSRLGKTDASVNSPSSQEALADMAIRMTEYIARHLLAIAVWSLLCLDEIPPPADLLGEVPESLIDRMTIVEDELAANDALHAAPGLHNLHQVSTATVSNASVGQYRTPSPPKSPPDDSRESPFKAPSGVEEDLEDLILGAHVVSAFPEGMKHEFIPNDKLEELVTANSVATVLFADEFALLANPRSIGHELVEFVLKSAKKVFTISLICGLTGFMLKDAMAHFELHSFGDKDLPLPSFKVLNEHLGFSGWSKMRKKIFIDFQWKVLAPVFPKAFVKMALREEEILPFTAVGNLRKEGTFGNVYKVTIHPSHQEEPERKVRYCDCNSVSKQSLRWIVDG